jgi:hypothetical protein
LRQLQQLEEDVQAFTPQDLTGLYDYLNGAPDSGPTVTFPNYHVFSLVFQLIGSQRVLFGALILLPF